MIDLLNFANLASSEAWEFAGNVVLACAGLIVAYWEIRRGSDDVSELQAQVQALTVDVAVLKQTTVTVEDWSGMNTRIGTCEAMCNKLVDEWSGETEDDA